MINIIKSMGKKTTIVFIGTITSKIFAFIFSILIGRLLGAEVYGEFIYVISFLSVFVIISKLGLENGIIYFLSRDCIDSAVQKNLVSLALISSILFSSLIVVLLFLYENVFIEKALHNIKYENVFIILLPTILLLSIQDILISVLKGKNKTKEFVFVTNFLIPIIKLISAIFFIIILDINNIYSLVISYYASTILGIIYLIKKINKYNMIGHLKKQKENSDLIKFSASVLFAGIIVTITGNIDQYMIGYLLNSKQVGIYRIALQFATISSFALASINIVFAPIISKLYHKGEINELSYIYKMSTKWITIINLMIFGAIILFSKDIMRIVGTEFIVGNIALIIIALGQLVNSAVGSVGYMHIMTGHPEYHLYSSIIVIIINIILNIILIPLLGIEGAALATMISLILSNVIRLILLYKNLRIHPYNMDYIKVVQSFIVTIIITYFIIDLFGNMNYLVRLLICGSIYVFIYIALIYKLSLDKYELQILKERLKKR